MIELSHIYKIFPPGTVAVRDVSLDIRDGEIHAIVGENGAGKSTLMRILYGMIRPDSGSIRVNSRVVKLGSPRDAMALGIGMVHQELMLVPSLSVYENIVLGDEPTRPLGQLDWAAARGRVDALARQLRLGADPAQPVERLSIAAQQKVEILKLLYRDVRVLILDEPTAVLTPQETEDLFARLREFSRAGKTVLFISHKLDEVLAISDRITVMRQGRIVETLENRGLSRASLARLMVGSEHAFAQAGPAGELSVPGTTGQRVQSPKRDAVLRLEEVRVAGRGGRPALDGVSLEVFRGEIVGIAGVEGNGQAELVEVIAGLRRPQAGRVIIDGQDVTHLPINARRRAGLALVPQDRKGSGAAPLGSLVDNAVLGHHRRPHLTRWGGRLLDRRAMHAFTVGILSRYRVVAAGPGTLFRSLSGGNQQKLILGRELAFESPLLVLDQPTRGLDIASTQFVHETLMRLREQSKGILVVSADLDELLSLADRILVLFEGRIVGQLSGGAATREQVGQLMLGGRVSA